MPDSQVVLITGASSGIGHATSLAFACLGWCVVGTGRREARLQTLKQMIESDTPGQFYPIVADVRDMTAMQEAVTMVEAQFGQLDVLVVNAGVGHRGSVVESDWEDVETLLRTNIDGAIHSIRAAVPLMRKAGSGHIVIVSSVAHTMVMPYAAYYGASKAFVSSLARSLRFELEPDGIGVSDMLVGRTDTEFSAKRLGKAGRSGGGIPVMPVDGVAQAIVRAVEKKQKRVTLRWVDRLLLLVSAVAPGLFGRLAMRQYK